MEDLKVQGKTHLITGAAFGAVAANQGFIEPSLLNTLIVVVASVLPDIDKKGTTASRKSILPFHLLFKHRAFTHSLLGAALFIFLLNILVAGTWPAFVVGFLAHIISDMLTSHGIKLLWPLDISLRFPITCVTGSLSERVFATVMVLICIKNAGSVLGI